MFWTYARIVLVIAAATLTACNGDGNGSAMSQPNTTTEIASQEIQHNTTESAVPIEINDLPISDADSTDTGLPAPI